VNGPARQPHGPSSAGSCVEYLRRALGLRLAGPAEDAAIAPSPRPRAAALVLALSATALLCALVAFAGTSSSAEAAPPAQFGSEGVGAGQFVEPHGIAVDQQSGELYLADRNNQRIERFSAEGRFELAWGWGVADGGGHEAQACGPDAVPPAATCFEGLEGPGSAQFKFPAGVAVDNDSASASRGDVYVADARNARVEKFGPAGNFIGMFGGEVNATTSGDVCLAGETCQAGVEGTGHGAFQHLGADAIAVGPDGSVYVGDENRVQRFSPGGAWESQIVLPGGLVENTVQTLAVDSEGDIYVGAIGQSGIRKYDPSGNELGTPRDQTGATESFAIAIGPGDELLVNDFQGGRHHLLSFDATGRQTASFDAGPEAEDGARGIAYGEAIGSVYVLNPAAVRTVAPPAPGPLITPAGESAGGAGTGTATLAAVLNPEGARTEYHFEYGTTAASGTTVPIPEGALPASFEDEPISVALSGLAPGTLYHYRLLATNVDGTVEGPDQTFETLPPVSIDSTSASAVSATGATLEAELNPHGVAGGYHFEYGPTTAYDTATPVGSLGAGSTDVRRTALLQDLEPGVTYHYRVVAENSLGTVLGQDHTFTTQLIAGFSLPDGRAWELVSPPDKHGSPLEAISNEGGVIQASANGSGITYLALGPLVGDPAGNRTRSYSQDLSERGPNGWSTEDITTPHETVAIFHPGFTGEYRAFSTELGSAAVEPQGATPLSAATTERTPYRRESGGTYTPLVTAANVAEGVEFGGVESGEELGAFSGGVEFVTATSDFRHIVLASRASLTGGFAGGERSLYDWSAGQLKLISVLPGGQPAALAGLSTSVGHDDLDMRSAISGDGSRVIFETSGAEGHLYVRDLALEESALVDVAEPGLSTGLAVPVFQGASADGARIFFTDEARLTADSTAAPSRPDLYMCEVKVSGGTLSCTVSDLTVDPTPGASADVQGYVLGVDQTGDRVFFTADGVLSAAPDARGEVAAPGNCSGGAQAGCNLYMYDTPSRQVSLVAVLSGADAPDWAHGVGHELGNLTARVSADGRYLAFMSDRSLTGYDNRDRVSGARDQEVFRYDSVEDALTCVSCDPTGARPLGVFDKDAFPGLLVDRPQTWGGQTLAGSIPGWTLRSVLQSTYQSRYLSNSGRLIFNAADALVAGDSNGLEDVYEFETPQGPGQPQSDGCTSASPTYSGVSGGCVGLISSGTSGEESAFLDASESGDDVFFLTAAKLSATDSDAAADVYDAHVCSAELPCPPPPAPTPPACAGDACQAPASPPAHPTPGTLLLNGPGNVLQCPKGKVKKGGRCAKKHQPKKHKKKHQQKKHRSSNQKKKKRAGASGSGGQR
jgi:NHL repeat